MSLEQLMQRADVWRGSVAPPQPSVATGFAALDTELAGGGWPRGALSEILVRRPGSGELTLLLPALTRLSHEDRWLAFVAPPYLPYAPALVRAGVDLAHALLVQPQDSRAALWAAEQALRSGACGAVLIWGFNIDDRSLRRLQLAAETGGGLAFLFRSIRHAEESSPAALRLKLKPLAGLARRFEARILKRRGGWPTGPILLNG
jgi:cell division inhibitor SulA/protein ImuA